MFKKIIANLMGLSLLFTTGATASPSAAQLQQKVDALTIEIIEEYVQLELIKNSLTELEKSLGEGTGASKVHAENAKISKNIAIGLGALTTLFYFSTRKLMGAPKVFSFFLVAMGTVSTGVGAFGAYSQNKISIELTEEAEKRVKGEILSLKNELAQLERKFNDNLLTLKDHDVDLKDAVKNQKALRQMFNEQVESLKDLEKNIAAYDQEISTLEGKKAFNKNILFGLVFSVLSKHGRSKKALVTSSVIAAYNALRLYGRHKKINSYQEMIDEIEGNKEVLQAKYVTDLKNAVDKIISSKK